MESCPGGKKPAVPWGGLKPGYGASEVSAVVCVEPVTKQFVQSAPEERQLFGALLVRSRTASTEGCLSLSLPSALCELITTARLQRSQPATQGRAHACECVWV